MKLLAPTGTGNAEQPRPKAMEQRRPKGHIPITEWLSTMPSSNPPNINTEQPEANDVASPRAADQPYQNPDGVTEKTHHGAPLPQVIASDHESSHIVPEEEENLLGPATEPPPLEDPMYIQADEEEQTGSPQKNQTQAGRFDRYKLPKQSTGIEESMPLQMIKERNRKKDQANNTEALPPLEITMTARRNDLTGGEKEHIRNIANSRGGTYRFDYIPP